MLTVDEIKALCAAAGLLVKWTARIDFNSSTCVLCTMDNPTSPLVIGRGPTDEVAIRNAWETYVNNR